MQREILPPTNGEAVHLRLDDAPWPWNWRLAGWKYPPLEDYQILCWKVTGIKPAKDPKDNVIWNSTEDKYITCRECLELSHA